jgi:hypothetical protein
MKVIFQFPSERRKARFYFWKNCPINLIRIIPPIAKTIPKTAYDAVRLAVCILFSLPAEKKYIAPESTNASIAKIPATDNKKNKIFMPIFESEGASVMTPA